MRHALCLFVLVAAAVLAGCGYAGEPRPPALKRPMRATELAAVERGSKIVITYTLPEETTEGLAISGSPDVELRVGVAPNPWNQEAWQASSDRVPVPAWQIPREASGGKTRKVTKGGAKAASGNRHGTAKQAPKRVAPGTIVQDKALFLRSAEIDASKYVGKSVMIGVRVHGPEGRDDGWSVVPLEVFPVLTTPRELRAVDAPNAVHLQWTADAGAFRIFRRLATDTDWVQIGDSTATSFDDKTFDYGKTWQYYVQAVRKAGANVLESEPTETITFAPVDRFPPAVPAGLVVISGIRTIEMSWDPVTDADLAGYRIYRGGVRIADGLLTPAYSDKDVTVGSAYSYQVSAVDRAGNESMRCAAQGITME